MKTLIYTNRYLSDVRLRKEMLIRHAINSAKIEGVVNVKKRISCILKEERWKRNVTYVNV